MSSLLPSHPSHIPHQSLHLATVHALTSSGFTTTTTAPLSLLTTVLERYISKLATLSTEVAALNVGRRDGRVEVGDVVYVLEKEMGMGSPREVMIGPVIGAVGNDPKNPITIDVDAPGSIPVPASAPIPTAPAAASTKPNSIPPTTKPEISPAPTTLNPSTGALNRLLSWVDEGEWGRAGDGENCLIGGLEGLRARNKQGLTPVYPIVNLPSVPAEVLDAFHAIPPSSSSLTALRETFDGESEVGSYSSSSSILSSEEDEEGSDVSSIGSEGSARRRDRHCRRRRRRSGLEPLANPEAKGKRGRSISSSRMDGIDDGSAKSGMDRSEVGRMAEKEVKSIPSGKISQSASSPTNDVSDLGEADRDNTQNGTNGIIKGEGKAKAELDDEENAQQAKEGDEMDNKMDVDDAKDRVNGAAIENGDKKRKREDEMDVDEGEASDANRLTNGLDAEPLEEDKADHAARRQAERKVRHRRRRQERYEKGVMFAIRLAMFKRMKAIEEANDGDAWGGILPPLPGTEALGLGGVEDEEEDAEKREVDGMDLDDVDGEDSRRGRSVSLGPKAVDGSRPVDSSHLPEEVLEAIAVSSRSPLSAWTMDPVPYNKSALSTSHPPSHISRFHKRLRTRDPPALYTSTLPALLEAYDEAKRQDPQANINMQPHLRKEALDVMSATTADPLLYERAGTTLVPIGFASATSGAMPKGSPFVPSYPIYGKNSQPVNADHEADKKVPEVYPTRPISTASVQATYLSRGMAHPPPSALNPLEPRVLRNMLAEMTGDPSKPETSKTPYLTAEILAELTSLRPPPPLKREGDNQPALFGDAVFAPGQLDAEGQAKAKKLKLQKEKTLKLKLTLGGGGTGAAAKGKGKVAMGIDDSERDEIYLGATWDIGDAGDWTKWNGLKNVDPKKVLSSARNKSLETYLEEINGPTVVTGGHADSETEGRHDQPGDVGVPPNAADTNVPPLPTPKIKISFARPMSATTTPTSEMPPVSLAGSPITAHPAQVANSSEADSVATKVPLVPLASESRALNGSTTRPSNGSTDVPRFGSEDPARLNQQANPAPPMVSAGIRHGQEISTRPNPTINSVEAPRPPTVTLKLSGLAGLPARPQSTEPPKINAGIMAMSAAGNAGPKLKFKFSGGK